MEVLYGGDIPKRPSETVLLIAECLENPSRFYLNVERIVKAPSIKEMRLHLVRAQIDSELNMRENVDLHTQRLWVAQTLERMVFGGLMTEGENLEGKKDDGKRSKPKKRVDPDDD